tara:strand:+ start:3723 stop:4739 length:1017 start_codon:yes stop_codon:yes gene_type:complete
MKKKIALVGGSGFIGHNLAIFLKKKGHDIYIVDSLSVNNLYSFKSEEVENKDLYKSILRNRIDLISKNDINLHIQDARNYNSLSQYLGSINPDIIIMLAAVSHANKSNKDPHNTFDHSIRTLENCLDIARGINKKNKFCHLIYFSSSMVYGNFISESVNEKTNCKPIGIYDTLKYSGELIVKSYNRVFELPYTIIRPSALYGERCVSRRVTQIFIENAVQGKDISIKGDKNKKLDFTYIEDLLHGVELIIENKKAINETFNITYGQSKSLLNLTEILKDNFKGIKINFEKEEKFVPARGTLDISKAQNLLGYKPKFPIEIGYINYINWYKKYWKNNFS